MKGNQKVMDEYVAKDFGKLLKRNALQMRRLMLTDGTDVMRVYDRNLAELPIAVDLYGTYARITDYSDREIEGDQLVEICDITSRMLYIEPSHVVYHQRAKRQGKEQHEIQQDQSLLVTVKENGLHFNVDLTKRIDTGLFLDQMVARRALRDVSKGMDVLNLFSYTGSFSVYAAAGGAKSVTSVDLSSTYTQWCEQNLAANGFSGGAYPCVSQDAAEYIRKAAKERRKFDIIVFDPPSFSNSRKMEHDFDVRRDYIYFIGLLNGILVNGGKLLFSTNLGGFRFEKRKIHGYDVREVTRDIAAPGFSAKKSSLRSWILEKKEEVQMPLEEEVQKVVPAEEVVEAAVEAVEPLVDLQNEEEVVAEEFQADEEDDMFVIDWDGAEEETPSDTKKNAKQRRYERRHPGETAGPVTPVEERETENDRPQRDDDSRGYNRPRRDDRPRRDSRSRDGGRDRGPRRFDNDRPRGDRPFDRDRPPRRFDNDRPRGDRPFDRDRPPRRFDNDRPRGDRPFDRDRPPRRFDNDRPRGDRPFDRDRPPRRFDNDRPRGDRPFDRDRPPRRFDNDRPRDDRPFDRDRPPRRFDNDRPRDDRPFDRDRPPRRFDNDRPRGDRPFDRDRPPRRFDNDRPRGDRPFDRDRPPRRFDNDRPRGDRPFDRDRPPRRFDNDRPRGDRSFDRDDRSQKSGPKPYGYDRFKPTRTRGGDQETFFRLDEDKKDRKRED
ncbi:class I SAM-dependent methyltransferase [Pleomorphochaeta sp. DL1XJH-081]|uniref:class I SAM-dependent methyltransferase n=1 Tax=Pleomorphochaeta sp. DL1XJH-081 TaxID=3409690 RepID=UPI003BB707A5